MKRILVIFALIAQTGTAAAADKMGRYLVIGHGAEPCRHWVAERKKVSDRAQELESWIMGFVTATNVWRPDTGDVTGGLDGPALFEWTDNYCKAHPNERLAEAARNLIFGLYELHRRTPKKGK